MADWGELGAGFLKGFSDYTSKQMAADRDQQRAIERAKLLEELRASTDERLAEFRAKLDARQTDKDLSGLEGDEMVLRDKDGNEKSRRAATADEREARDRTRAKADLDMRKGEADIRQSDAAIRQGDERNALTRRGQDLDFQASRERTAASIANSRATNATDAGSGVGGGSSTAIGYQLTSLNEDSVEQAAKNGVPREMIQRAAAQVAAQHLASGKRDVAKMNDDFLRALTILRRGIEGTGNEATWSLSTYQGGNRGN